MLSIEEVKQNLINCDIKLVFYSSAITMMHGQINIRFTYVLVSQNGSTHKDKINNGTKKVVLFFNIVDKVSYTFQL